MSTDNSQKLWAAIDLGSNSFHLLLVQVDDTRIRVIEQRKEKVQLLGGAENGVIQPDALARGLACIRRYKQRLAEVNPTHVQVMGTYALRRATNAQRFVTQVGAILGSPLNVISGQQEADLIFKAVGFGFGTAPPQNHQPQSHQLVFDIGGGSTEIGIGQFGETQTSMSLEMGCVAFKDAYFKSGQSFGYELAKQQALDLLANSDLEPFVAGAANVEVIGCSGTIESVQTVLRANGWAWHTITADAMQRLETAIAQEQWIVDAGVPGLAPDRIDIFPAGVAILKACFEVLNLKALRYVEVSLLHGMIFDAIGTKNRPDMRNELADQSVTELAQRFAVDVAQSERVERTATRLFQQLHEWWSEPEICLRWLVWAARLHEIGMHVNARHYHRHGSYVLKHAELPGLDVQERDILALLVRGHRRSMPGLAFQAFDPALADTLTRLVAVLRIAVILERSHSDDETPAFNVVVLDQGIGLEFAGSWLTRHSLSERELTEEVAQLQSVGIELTFVGC